MYFTNIYKTLKQLERNRAKVKKLQETILWVALTKLIFLFHPHNLAASCSNSSGYCFTKRAWHNMGLYLGGGEYIQNNILVCKRMGLNPGGGGFNMGFYDNFASLLTAVNAMSFKHE